MSIIAIAENYKTITSRCGCYWSGVDPKRFLLIEERQRDDNDNDHNATVYDDLDDLFAYAVQEITVDGWYPLYVYDLGGPEPKKLDFEIVVRLKELP